MTIAIIGSRALALRAPHAIRRPISDFDFVCTVPELWDWVDKNKTKVGWCETKWVKDNKFILESLNGGTNVEFEVAKGWGNSTDMLVQLIREDPDTRESPFGLIPSLDLLFTLKRSHRHLKNSPHFWKTLADYHLLKKMGCKVREEWKAFLKLREKETYDYKHPSLNQSKKDFFNGDGIVYTWDHDTIHVAMALFDEPIYKKFLKDDAPVKVDKAKFMALPHEQKLASVVEETAVLAIERSLVPHPGVKTPKQAWHFALSKVLSSITSGWWRAWAYEHALEVLKMYPDGYWERFQEAVKQGIVKPHGGADASAA